jgi:hypothetical protein
VKKLQIAIGIALVMAQAAGCGAPTPVGSGGAAGAAGSPGDAGTSCETQPRLDARKIWACAQPITCPEFHITPEGVPHVYPGNPLARLEDARCVLRALRDGKPGEYEVEVERAAMPGYWVDRHTLNVLPDGTVVHSLSETHDSSGYVRTTHVVRKPTPFFEACLSLPFGPDLYTCLTDFAAGSASGCPVCPNSGTAGELCDEQAQCQPDLACCRQCALFDCSVFRCVEANDGVCP